MQEYIFEATMTITISNVFSEAHAEACFWKAIEDMGLYVDVDSVKVIDAYEID